MQRNKGFMKLLSLCMYVCMYGELSAIGQSSQSATTIAAASSIYECNPAINPGLLASIVARQKSSPEPVKLATSRVVNCEDEEQVTPLSCPATLNIVGDISITESKNVAITVSDLSDITVSGGPMAIYIPTGGSLTINGTAYTTSPIAGLNIVEKSTPGVAISCRKVVSSSHGALIDENITLNAQGNVTISNNTATSENNGISVYGVFISGTIVASENIEMNNNTATSSSNTVSSFGVRCTGDSTIQALGNITMNNNQVTSQTISIGVNISSTVKTGGNFIISVTTTDLPENTNQNFNSTTVITNLSDIALIFNQFTITIDEDEYGSTGGNYGTMQTDHPGVVSLNSTNQLNPN